MDNRQEISEFFRTRRAKVSSADVGLGRPGNRRVPGLRREEVAVLADVSIEYYKRIERGALAGVSDEILTAIAKALRLDDAETGHLFNLAAAASPSPGRVPKAPVAGVRPNLQRILDTMVGSPAHIRNERMDLLAANALGRALYRPVWESAIGRGNNARFAFLDPYAREFYPDWDRGAVDVVAVLRLYAGRRPDDTGLSDLIGELVTKSDEFARLWATYDIKYHRAGAKKINHPLVGEMELEYESMEMPTDPGLTIFNYFAEPGSPSAERLAQLDRIAAQSEHGAVAAADR